MIISIEGNIGSGKSTLLKILKKELAYLKNFTFIQEPINSWLKITDIQGENILSKFYGDQEKYGFAFQVMAFTTKLQLIKDNLNQDYIITERSVNTDKEVFAKMLHKDNKIDDICMAIYSNLFDTFIEDKTKINKIIYIKTNPNICYQRVNKRKRGEEKSIPLEYLQKCDEYHNIWLENNDNVLILNGNIEFENDKNTISQWCRQIINFLCE